MALHFGRNVCGEWKWIYARVKLLNRLAEVVLISSLDRFSLKLLLEIIHQNSHGTSTKQLFSIVFVLYSTLVFLVICLESVKLHL